MKQIFLLIFVLFFVSCSNSEPKKLKIAVNSWIGYTPLFYAQEKGYLEKININLVPTVSLGESADIFGVAKVDMLTATQHELHALEKNFNSIEAIILIDRSNGGDMILSNRTIEQLQKSKKISTYLEIDSINSEMIRAFTKNNKINEEVITYINKDQSQIQELAYTDSEDTIIVTYTPYNNTLESKGYFEVASTKDINNIIVIDSICTTKEFRIANKQTLKQLKAIIDRSIKEINSNPREAHRLTQKYLNDITFEEYKDSMKTIKWINNPTPELLLKLENINYLKESLI